MPPPLFSKVVIVLIDALRDDFVFGPSGKRFMPYTRNLVESGSSHSFIAKARPPTVTMPRIKVSPCTCTCVETLFLLLCSGCVQLFSKSRFIHSPACHHLPCSHYFVLIMFVTCIMIFHSVWVKTLRQIQKSFLRC